MTTTNDYQLLDRIIPILPPSFEFIDNFNGKVITNVNLTIIGEECKKYRQVISPRGFYLIYGMEYRQYSLRAEALGFEKWESTLDISPMQNPLKITLNPSPSYRFPVGSTLIRGMSYSGTNANSLPYPGLKISLSIANVTLSTLSSARGEFVFYLQELSNNSYWIETGGTWFVRAPTASNKLNFNLLPAVNYQLLTDPAQALVSSTEFIWKIGSELHINLFT